MAHANSLLSCRYLRFVKFHDEHIEDIGSSAFKHSGVRFIKWPEKVSARDRERAQKMS